MSNDAPSPIGARRRDPQAKRRLLLQAARSLFVANGFEATTTRMIASSAGVSEGILFHQFGSKLGLFSELVRDYSEYGTASFLPEEADNLSSAQVVHSVLAYIESDRELFQLIHDNQAMLTAQEVPAFKDYVVPAIERRLVKYGEDNGHSSGDPAIMAELQFAIVEAGCRMALQAQNPATKQAYIDEAIRCLDAVNS